MRLEILLLVLQISIKSAIYIDIFNQTKAFELKVTGIQVIIKSKHYTNIIKTFLFFISSLKITQTILQLIVNSTFECLFNFY